MNTIRLPALVFLSGLLLLLALPAAAEEAQPRRNWGVAPLPIIAYSPDYGGMFGAVAIFFYGPDVGVPEAERQGLRNNTLALNAIVTTNGSFIGAASATNYLRNEQFRWDNTLSGNRIPRTFFGLGPEADLEEKYAALTLGGSTTFTVRAADNLYVGPLYEYRYVTISDLESGGVLETGVVRGSEEKTIASGIGVRAIRDTSGGGFWPTGGYVLDTDVRFFSGALGSTDDFGLYGADFRKYISLFRGHVLALQGRYRGSWGDTPFHFLPSVGGDGPMRGLLEHRYRDETAVTAQMEYRLPLTSRFGVVGFFSAGQVAGTVDRMDLTDPAVAGGLGFRVALNQEQKLNLRIDIAFSPMGVSPYVNVREAF